MFKVSLQIFDSVATNAADNIPTSHRSVMLRCYKHDWKSPDVLKNMPGVVVTNPTEDVLMAPKTYPPTNDLIQN